MSKRIFQIHFPNPLFSSKHVRPSHGYDNLPLSSPSYSTTTKLRPTRVLITGGSRGIGLAIAHAFTNTGNHSIQLIGRNPSTLSSAIQSLQECFKSHNPTTTQEDLSQLIKAHVADISDPSIWKNAFASNPKRNHEDEGDRWDVPDILINSAGVTHSSLLMAMKPTSIQEIINTNLLGTIYACQAVSKAMLRAKKSDASPRHSPVIINIASLLATHGGRGSSVYSASKAGVLGLTRALAAELGPSGIRVNAIVPGYIETSMTEAMDPTAKENALGKVPLKRFGTVEEIAEAALFLAKNEYANNCVINLDGGLSAAL